MEQIDPKKILERISHKGLRISRLPDSTKKKFIALAEKEFCSDYGMCLKFLVDDLIDVELREVIGVITSLNARVEELELLINTKPDNKDGIKTLSGKIIRRGK